VRLASFTLDGRASFGAIDGDAIIDLGHALPDVPSIDAALELGALAAVRAASADGAAARVPLADLQFELPVAGRRIFCIGINYADHRDEMGRELVPFPTVFVRFASSLVPHGAPLERPMASDRCSRRRAPSRRRLQRVHGRQRP
jgi:2-keto-4-pentenoate hydratase/2-oxohepta-3-ene-1,7-dioic acid hydratase in catechol pathway